MRPRARQAGFTAIEVMVVVAILAILAAFAAPSMSQLIRTQKVRGTAYDIFADLTYARSEAIGRGHDVTVTSANGTDWVLGWTIRDVNSNQMLRTQGELSKGLTFTGDVKELTFDRNGRSNANAQFSIEPTESGVPDNQKRCVRISPSGRPNSLTGPCP